MSSFMRFSICASYFTLSAKTVRYVNTSSGVNVRDAAAGNKVRSLLQGTLMIYDTANAPVKKALNGTTYTWIKVTYYYKGSNDQYLSLIHI